jgi:hypothetical protein
VETPPLAGAARDVVADARRDDGTSQAGFPCPLRDLM